MTLLALRLVLAIVLGVAGVAKLADSAGTRVAVQEFGVPERLAGPLAAWLPQAELLAAALLLPLPTARAGGALALALLLAFSAAIARSVARGQAPDCHCFGQLHSAPAGPKTLARNLALAAAAAAVTAAGPGAPVTAAAVGIAAAALLLGGIAELVTRLLRRHGQLLLRIEQLERELAAARGGVAEPALIALDGRHTTLTELRAPGIPLLLVFTDPACGPCTALMPELGAWQREHAGSLRTVLISRGAPETNLEHARRHGVTDVLLQDGLELDERFGVVGTPSAVLIAADGTAVSAVHAGVDQIRALVARHVAATSPAVLAA